jgi:DNA-binding MarR family transcriptional regulator
MENESALAAGEFPERPGEFPEGPLAWDVVLAAISCSQQLVRKIERALATEELTWAQWRTLNVIGVQRGWIHASSVARKTGVSRQAATTLFARLDARGFLTWLDEDWIKSVQLTRAGEDARTRGWRALTDIRSAIDRLSLEERRGLVSADDSLHRELMRGRFHEPWYWDYLPAHLQKENSIFER